MYGDQGSCHVASEAAQQTCGDGQGNGGNGGGGDDGGGDGDGNGDDDDDGGNARRTARSCGGQIMMGKRTSCRVGNLFK